MLGNHVIVTDVVKKGLKTIIFFVASEGLYLLYGNRMFDDCFIYIAHDVCGRI